jgi:hypothetical protein
MSEAGVEAKFVLTCIVAATTMIPLVTPIEGERPVVGAPENINNMLWSLKGAPTGKKLALYMYQGCGSGLI